MFLRRLFLLTAICTMGQLVTGDIVHPRGEREISEVETLTSGESIFSQKLYSKLAVNQPNLIYSPHSAHVALTMTLHGARGDTADQMTTVLELSDVSSSASGYHSLIQDFQTVQDVELLTGNALYINPDTDINNEFKEVITTNYDAKVDNIDMSAAGGPETPINSWVAQKTKNQITDLLQSGDIDDDIALLIINTIFFNGTWKDQFPKQWTMKADFHKQDGSSKVVDMMYNDGHYKVKSNAIPGVDAISIPFKGDRFSFVVALPQDTNGLPALEAHIKDHPNDVSDLISFQSIDAWKTELFLPKFKITATIDLKNSLTEMGMDIPFTRGAADFSGIGPTPLYISKAVQKATIEVREEGTVAAAATGIGFSTYSMGTQFMADHPFMFFLKDDVSGQILFQGKFADPDVQEIEI